MLDVTYYYDIKEYISLKIDMPVDASLNTVEIVGSRSTVK